MFVCLFSYLWSVLGCGEETILIWEMFLAIARTKSKGLSDSACLPIIKSPTDPDTILPQRESQRGMFLLEDFLFFLLTLSTILFLSLGKGLATKLDEFSGKCQGGGGVYVADFGNFKQGFLIIKLIQTSNFKVQGMIFTNCIEKNQNRTHFEEGTSESLYYLAIIPPRIYATISVLTNLQYNFPKMRRGHTSKAVWNFSKE